MFAAHHRLDNLHLIVDDNRTSMLGFTDDIVSHNNLEERMTAFGWDVTQVQQGHDVLAVHDALTSLKARKDGKPKALIAHTLKGRGVPGLENEALSHILTPKPEVLESLIGKKL